jgi:hypothetical protein
MKRALVVALLCGCSSNPMVPDSGTPDAGMDVTQFNVSGTAAMFPEGAAMLADAGLSTSIVGLRIRVEEPFKIAINDNDPLGIFSVAHLDATGAFSAQDVQVDLVTLGVAGGILDDTDAGRVIRSATTIWDVALEGKKPDHDITGAKAWAIPTQYHDALTAAVTPAQIRTITGDAGTLIEAGFILGRIVDANGAGVAGVTLTPTASVEGQFFYPTADLTGTMASTSSNGLFLYVHNGGDVETFRVNVTSHTEYKTRQAGAAANACLVLTIYPGDTAP